jgi:hypothetical protein
MVLFLVTLAWAVSNKTKYQSKRHYYLIQLLWFMWVLVCEDLDIHAQKGKTKAKPRCWYLVQCINKWMDKEEMQRIVGRDMVFGPLLWLEMFLIYSFFSLVSFLLKFLASITGFVKYESGSVWIPLLNLALKFMKVGRSIF